VVPKTPNGPQAIDAPAAGLVAANYHFVGDVVAGAFVGITAGMLAQGIWDIWRRRHPWSAWAQGNRM